MKSLVPLFLVLLCGAARGADPPMTPDRDFYLSGIIHRPGEVARHFGFIYRDADLRGVIKPCVVEEGDAIPGTGWVLAYCARSSDTGIYRALVIREDGRKLARMDMPVKYRYTRSPR